MPNPATEYIVPTLNEWPLIIHGASPTAAGVMSAADKAKLDGIPIGGGSTLDAVYQNGTSVDNTVLLTAAGGGVRIWDNAIPLAVPLFQVASALGASPYASITPTATTLGGNLRFTVSGSGRLIAPNDETDPTIDGTTVTIRAGHNTIAGSAQFGGDFIARSGNGAPGTAGVVAARGGDLAFIGGDAGANGGAGGSTGGNVYIGGGLGTNAAEQHGGVLIGTDDVMPVAGLTARADEIRIGHKPSVTPGTIDLGHIRHLGYFADSLSIFPADDYTIRFENKAGSTHFINADATSAGGGSGTAISFSSGRGGNATAGVVAGVSGAITIFPAQSGDGNATRAPAAGAALTLRGGAAGTIGAFGSPQAGGDCNIDGGAASAGGTDGRVFIGTLTTSRVAIESTTIDIGEANAVITLGSATNNDIAFNARITTVLSFKAGGSRTFNIAQSGGGAGNALTVAAGQGSTGSGGNLFLLGGAGDGSTGGQGGDIFIVGGARGAQSFGGSIIIDGTAGSAAANDGVVLIGTNNAGGGGQTYRVQICGATARLSFFGSTSVVQQTVGAVTNSVTAGGVDGTIADFADLTTYSNSAATIRNDIYQLARSVAQLTVAVRNYGLGA